MYHVTLQLNAKLQPMHRGDLFEDPLNEFLEENNLGGTSGGGTLLAENNEVNNCDIEIDMSDISEASLNCVIAEIERLGAPKGSWLRLHDSATTLAVGKAEGLGVYLNGTDLPDEVYQSSDVNVVYDELEKRIDGIGKILSYWDGPEETAFYLYGDSFVAMQEKIADFLASYPLCQQCRVVQIA